MADMDELPLHNVLRVWGTDIGQWTNQRRTRDGNGNRGIDAFSRDGM